MGEPVGKIRGDGRNMNKEEFKEENYNDKTALGRSHDMRVGGGDSFTDGPEPAPVVRSIK